MAHRPLAVFVPAASPAIGAGHAMRCLTLAQGLERRGWRTRFAVTAAAVATVPTLGLNDPLMLSVERGVEEIGAGIGRCDLLVVDDYGLGAAFETPCRVFAERILALDDLADRAHDCDILIDQNLGTQADAYRNLVPAECRLLIGTAYALLRPEFARLRPAALAKRKQTHLPTRLLISFGSTDPGNLTERAIVAARDADLGLAIDVVLGPGAPHLDRIIALAGERGDVRVRVGVGDMTGLMVEADFAVGATGITAWERCCLGLPALVMVLAENQQRNAEALARAGAVELLGWHANIDVAGIAAGLVRLRGDLDHLARMADAAAGICDGRGVERVTGILAANEEVDRP